MHNVSGDEHLLTWISRLTSPEMCIERLKKRRNCYLLYLCLTLYSGTLRNCVFEECPPTYLPNIHLVKANGSSPPPPSELDTLWTEQQAEDLHMTTKLNAVNTIKCGIHKNEPCPSDPADEHIGKVLNNQFQFFLHLAHKHVHRLPQAMYRLRAAVWIQTLCCIPHESCALMKGIRNDYMMLLLGYIESGLLLGPFQQFPPDQLISLKEAAEQLPDAESDYASNSEVDEMLRKMPRPEYGAFAFLGISPDLCQE